MAGVVPFDGGPQHRRDRRREPVRVGGPFLWTTQVRTTTLTCDVGEQQVQTWCAEHDGYLRLNTPTMHRRSVTLDSPERRLTFIDTFDVTEVIRCA